MVRRNYLDDFVCGRMIDKIEVRQNVTRVSHEFGINKRVISHAWKIIQTTDTAIRKKDWWECPRQITLMDDLYIILQLQRDK